MSDASTPASGRCLCGTVRFLADVAKREIDVCHCHMCRRWSSGPSIGLSYDGDVRFEGEDSITVYRSSEWGERAFCKHCASALYWHLVGSDHYSFPVGALDDQSALRLTSQIFIEEKPDYYDFANDTPRLTGAEVVAAFASGKATE